MSSEALPRASHFRQRSCRSSDIEARVARPPLQQRCVRNHGLVRAGMAARAHQVKRAQVFEAEGVARRHGRAC